MKEYQLELKQKGEEKVLLKELEILEHELDFNKKYKALRDSLERHFGKLNFINSPRNMGDSLRKDSITNLIIYNLPDSVQKKFKEYFLKEAQLSAKRALVEDTNNNYNIYIYFYLVGLYAGEIISLLGFIFWYRKIQKPIDDEQENITNQKWLKGELWAMSCQSCRKSFLSIEEYGTNADNSQNVKFCYDCYSNGNFTEPDLSLEAAKERLKLKLKSLNYSKRNIRKELKNFKTPFVGEEKTYGDPKFWM